MKRNEVFVLIAAVMVTCYLAANCMAVKIIEVAGISIFDCGTLIFPLTFMAGETVTEVWGLKRARRLVLVTFGCQLLFTLCTWIVTLLPYPEEQTTMAAAYHEVFQYVPRIMAASLTAFVIGELTNVYLMSYIRDHIGGPLFIRTILSSLAGYSLDTTIFVLIAFLGVMPRTAILSMIVIQIAVKVIIECCAATPMTYGLVHIIETHTQD